MTTGSPASMEKTNEATNLAGNRLLREWHLATPRRCHPPPLARRRHQEPPKASQTPPPSISRTTLPRRVNPSEITSALQRVAILNLNPNPLRSLSFLLLNLCRLA